MAMLPEEFPVVLTVFLVLGAWRISQHEVLTRNAPAVETLGAATVLCTDKTGTITLNRMTVHSLFVDGQLYDIDYDSERALPESFHQIVEYSILASQKDPFDPMEKAFKELGEHFLAATEHLHGDWVLERRPLPKGCSLSRGSGDRRTRKTTSSRQKGHPRQSLTCATFLKRSSAISLNIFLRLLAKDCACWG